MKRSTCGLAVLLGGIAGFHAVAAMADTAYSTEGATTSFLKLLTDRLEFTLRQIPALVRYLASLPDIVGARTALLLLAIVVAGLAAEYVVRLILSRARLRGIDRLVGHSPLRAFGLALVLDFVALIALAVAAHAVVLQLGDSQSLGGRLGHQVARALIYWRTFNLLFRAWLRPGTPEGRIVPVDDQTARGLLLALNLVVLLPLLAGHVARALETTGASNDVTAAAVILYVPLVAAGILWVVWHWRHEMTAWLTGMISERKIGYRLKLDIAKRWWVFGLVFYGLMGMAAIYAALTQNATTSRGLSSVESTMLALLLFETLMHRITRHIVSELPMAGDVVADCLRLIARLYVVIVVAEALMVRAFGFMTAEEWQPHDSGAKVAAVTAVAIYAFWRFLRFRMDSYIASNPLPSADVSADNEDDVQVAASRLRTLMPLLRAIAGITILVVGGLLVLAELGVNITPLIAGASVFGLAVSFGSQSLVRDIVSGVFFLAEDSFRIGEYVDCSKVKGTVEGFSVRSLKLRHQNGQLHIVPFGQVAHITNFSRDWTVVKFNLAFANGTDVELLRKTVKKLGTDMMEESAFKPILLQPLKMQGVVDIKDNQLIVRFKFMTRPKNPTLVQRMAIRRMYETFPKLGIRFAVPIYPMAMPMSGAPSEPASIAGNAPAAAAAAAAVTTSAAANIAPTAASLSPVEAVKAAE
ncbi:MAG: mechanosensitive ion channel [Alphaproteobacteria bacterium]|nr:mechanosensitive ion channel [Alphaproteobacteria bacterium]MBV8408289.1 mechanosensitive ion channel [Alphaproteobacteria bacterium]